MFLVETCRKSQTATSMLYIIIEQTPPNSHPHSTRGAEELEDLISHWGW